MFQLSDDSVDDNDTEEDQIIGITNEQQQHHHHSRKLLSIDEDDETSRIIDNDTNDVEFDLCLNNKQPIGTTDNLPFVLTSISKRQLLSVKTNKHSTSSKATNIKNKKVKSTTNTDATKPKVGWAYRYRISRYLNAQKMKRTGNKNKQTGGDKTKHLQKQQSNLKQNQKKTNSLINTKISKRKLLEYHSDDDSSRDNDKM
jgi:predicted nucleic acid-binding protein